MSEPVTFAKNFRYAVAGPLLGTIEFLSEESEESYPIRVAIDTTVEDVVVAREKVKEFEEVLDGDKKPVYKQF